VDSATNLVGDEDTLGRICGVRRRNGRGEAGGRLRDREHPKLPLSSTSELHKEDSDGTWASCLIPPKKPRTERDARPSSLSGCNRSVVPQSSTAARSCSRGTDWPVDSGRLERSGPLSLLVGAVRLTRLPALEQPPTFTFYVPVRQSWRRVEDVPSQRFVPHMGDRVGSCADAARATLHDRWAGRDDSDGSEASENGADGRPSVYFHLSCRMRSAATRRGIWSVVKTVGDGAAVVDSLATLVGCNAANARRTIALIERRDRDNETARVEQASTRARLKCLAELTGGVSLAVILGSGAPSSDPGPLSRTRPDSNASWTSRPLSTCLPVLGALPVHRARACSYAADDATAAGLGPSNRAWAVRQAGAAVAACTGGLRLCADVSVLREIRSSLRSPGAGVVAAEASLGGSLLEAVSRHVSTGTPMAVPTMPTPIATTVLERDTFSRLL